MRLGERPWLRLCGVCVVFVVLWLPSCSPGSAKQEEGRQEAQGDASSERVSQEQEPTGADDSGQESRSEAGRDGVFGDEARQPEPPPADAGMEKISPDEASPPEGADAGTLEPLVEQVPEKPMEQAPEKLPEQAPAEKLPEQAPPEPSPCQSAQDCPAASCRPGALCGGLSCQTPASTCIALSPGCNQGKCEESQQTVQKAMCAWGAGECIAQGSACSADSDCGKPQCKNQGNACVQTRASCLHGACQSQTTTFPYQACDAQSGLCSYQAGCNTLTGCDARACVDVSQCGAEYCTQRGDICTQVSPLCSSGQCSSSSQSFIGRSCSSGKCVFKPCSSASDCPGSFCHQSEGTCFETTSACSSQSCRTRAAQAFPGRVCLYSQGKCVPQTCQKREECRGYCTNLNSRECQQFFPTGCSAGACSFSPTKVFGRCDNTSGLCVRSQCSGANDCGPPTCFQQGDDCLEVSYTCRSSSCRLVNARKNSTRCNLSTGKCEPPTNACQKDRDCGVPRCQQSVPSSTGVYHASCTQFWPRCTTGACKTEVETNLKQHRCDESSGLCRGLSCTSQQECGQGFCQNDGIDCIQAAFVCLKGACNLVSKRHAKSACAPETGQCQPLQTCTQDSDCPKTSCGYTTTNCVQTSYTCQQSVCVQAQSSVSRYSSFCDRRTNQCIPSKRCSRASDCTSTLTDCAVSGVSRCLHVAVICKNQVCQADTNHHTDSVCNESRHTCEKIRTCSSTSGCGTATCRQVGEHCLNIVPNCTAGRCSYNSSIRTGYKCDIANKTCKRP